MPWDEAMRSLEISSPSWKCRIEFSPEFQQELRRATMEMLPGTQKSLTLSLEKAAESFICLLSVLIMSPDKVPSILPVLLEVIGIGLKQIKETTS